MEFESLDSLIEYLNDLNVIQNDYDFEDIPEDLWNMYFKNCLAHGLDIEKHRWYETSVSVFETELGIFGIRHVHKTYSEEMSVSDIYWQYEFFKMNKTEVVTLVYHKVKEK